MTDEHWTFRFEVPGAPPSTNHLYERARVQTSVGSYIGARKADGVGDYQSLASMCVKMSRPKGWLDEFLRRGKPYVRVRYRFYLKKDADADNLLKALNDAIAHGLGINDRSFLPAVDDKVVNHKEPARTEVEVSFA